VVLDLEPERIDRVVHDITAAGGRARGVRQDVKDDAGLRDTLVAEADRSGGLDVLVDVVGGATFQPTLSMPADLLDHESRHNLRHFMVAAQAFAGLAGSDGAENADRSLVAITSISGMVSSPGHAAYGAAKAGLISLVRTFAQEWGSRGIRVNAIAPGAVRTDRNDPPAEFVDRVADHAPLGRMGTQDEIGNVALFLSSPLASYVTGQVLAVDGGLLTNYPFPL
jgi:NAD(P)-dependent dehydrogenase (short-subunit alcohol dehydrogenase family)